MKIFKNIIFFITTLIFTANSYSITIDNQKFLRDYQKIVAKIINDYNNPKLNAQIFDISKQSYLDFLTSSTNYKKPGTQDIMGMQYYSNFKVNYQETAFCFILYDSKSNLVENYKKHTDLSIEEITQYLALHEMGHCLTMNQEYQNSGTISEPNIKELMADKFSIFKLFVDGKINIIEKILQINSSLPNDDIHKNEEQLLNFYQRLKTNEIPTNLNYDALITFIISDSH